MENFLQKLGHLLQQKQKTRKFETKFNFSKYMTEIDFLKMVCVEKEWKTAIFAVNSF